MSIDGSKFSILVEASVEKAKSGLNEVLKSLKNISNEVGSGTVGAGGGVPAHAGLTKGLTMAGSKISSLGPMLGIAAGGLAALGVSGVAVGAAMTAIDWSIGNIVESGAKLAEVGKTGVKAFGSLGTEIMKSGGAMEATMLRLKMLGKFNQDQALSVMKSISDIVEYTPFMEGQVMDLVTGLVTAKVPLDDLKDKFGQTMTVAQAVAKGYSQVDESVLKVAGSMKNTATTAVLDLAAATGNVGEKMDFFVRGFQRLLSTGQVTMLRDQLPMEIVDRLSKAGKNGATKVIEEMNKINMEKGWVGYSAAASTTFEGMVSNFKEIPLRFFKAMAGIGEQDSPYAKLKSAILDVYELINAPMKDASFMKNMRDMIQPVVDMASSAARALASMVKVVLTLIKDNPALARAAFTVTAVVAALLGIVGVAGTVVSAVGGVAAAVVSLVISFATLGAVALVAANVIGFIVLPAIVGLGVALAPVIAPFALVATVMGLIGAGAAVGAAASIGRMTEAFEKLQALGSGIVEFLWNFKDGASELSDETVSALDKTGMMGAFRNIASYIFEAKFAFDGFMTRLSSGWDKVGPRFGAAFDKMGEAMSRVWDALGALFKAFGILVPSTETPIGVAKTKYESLADKIIWVADVTASAANVMASAFDAITPHVGTVTSLLIGMYKAIIWVKAIGDVAFDLLKMSINAIAISLKMAWESATMFVTALEKLATGKPMEALTSLKDSLGVIFGTPGKLAENVFGTGKEIAGDIAEARGKTARADLAESAMDFSLFQTDAARAKAIEEAKRIAAASTAQAEGKEVREWQFRDVEGKTPGSAAKAEKPVQVTTNVNVKAEVDGKTLFQIVKQQAAQERDASGMFAFGFGGAR